MNKFRVGLIFVFIVLISGCSKEMDLKTKLAQIPSGEVVRGYPVALVEMPGAVYLEMRREVRSEDISSEMQEMYGVLLDYVYEHEAQLAGHPISFVYSKTDSTVNIGAGVPVSVELPDTDEIKRMVLSPSKAAMLVYMGSYTGISKAYEALDAWLEQHELVPAAPIYEVYITDPGSEPDPAKWVTEVYAPLLLTDAPAPAK